MFLCRRPVRGETAMYCRQRILAGFESGRVQFADHSTAWRRAVISGAVFAWVICRWLRYGRRRNLRPDNSAVNPTTTDDTTARVRVPRSPARMNSTRLHRPIRRLCYKFVTILPAKTAAICLRLYPTYIGFGRSSLSTHIGFMSSTYDLHFSALTTLIITITMITMTMMMMMTECLYPSLYFP